jgi:hypothetical protein
MAESPVRFETVAKRLGGRRIPITGRQRGDVPDVEHEWLSIEVKSKVRFPDWLVDAMVQAMMAKAMLERKAREEHKDGEWLPIVVLHQKGWRHDDDLVVVRLKDFVEWFGTVDASIGDNDLADGIDAWIASQEAPDLHELRSRIVESGEPLLDADEVSAEVRERR